MQIATTWSRRSGYWFPFLWGISLTVGDLLINGRSVHLHVTNGFGFMRPKLGRVPVTDPWASFRCSYLNAGYLHLSFTRW